MPAYAELSTIVFDCADPGQLADFYRALTGWQEVHRDDECVHLNDGGAVRIAFQRVDGYRPAGWPDTAKQAHLDLTVTDLRQAVKEVLAAGASMPEFQPGGDDWVVLADPQGHLFCLVATT